MTYPKFFIENYKGFDLHIFEVVMNPNGRKSQTVLIYDGANPIGGVFADIELENATQKAKAKIDKEPKYKK